MINLYHVFTFFKAKKLKEDFLGIKDCMSCTKRTFFSYYLKICLKFKNAKQLELYPRNIIVASGRSESRQL